MWRLRFPGSSAGELRRGDALIEAGAYPVSYRLDVELEELEPIADDARLQVHHGTAEIRRGSCGSASAFAQLRLATPVVAARGDHVVLRDWHTVGGGRVLDPAPPRAPDPVRLELLAGGDPASIVRALVHEPVRRDDLAARALLSPAELDRGAGRARAGRRLALHVRVARPGAPGGADAAHAAGRGGAARSRPAARETCSAARRGPTPSCRAGAGPARRQGLPPGRGRVARREGRRGGGFGGATRGVRPRPARVDDAELAAFLEAQGRLVRVGDGLAVGVERLRDGQAHADRRVRARRQDPLARFRDLLGVSRRPAQLLLERFDADGLTRRVGDERVLRSAARR